MGNCIQQREGKEGKSSRQIIHGELEIKLVNGLLEEFDCQTLINIDPDPLSSFVRSQAYKYQISFTFSYVRLDTIESDITQPRSGTSQIEDLRVQVFKRTRYIINYQIEKEIQTERLEEVLLEIINFANTNPNIRQIGFQDHFLTKVPLLKFHVYAKALLRAIQKYINNITSDSKTKTPPRDYFLQKYYVQITNMYKNKISKLNYCIRLMAEQNF
ncbi:hypothetical protein pb186bvf_014902 [Paramecium bursaria]